ncbi:hypothetical protein NDA10_006162 [Ustilago hordei]|nr:hypothetical protein NDA10_006162 [Ustilago hordei]KAJ1573800.1 hypothetical protein NDA15_004113 [Ustilago hordei]KAJ1579738.1 hypothetical protein NDA12_006117 [Ustilago hordei]
MSMAPQAIHSNLSRPHPTDSRLLQNLIKGEKIYIDNLAASSHSGYAAASALAAWGTSEAPDISKASQTLSEILASAADAQRTHVQALEGYRSALKDVLDREHSIRSVVRDRDILVGRLIKASKKKVSKKDSGLSQDEKMEKVNAAQRELHACEQVLASEEAALVGVKRRTFKEALTMRMKTMGDAGAAMVDAAKEAILLLDEFDTHGPLLQATGGGQYESMYADDGVETGAYDNQALDQAYYGGQQQPQGMPDQMQADKYGSPIAANGTNLTRDEQGRFHKHLQGPHLDSRNPQHFDGASVTPSQSASQVIDHDRSHVPLGQRYTSQFEDVEEQEGIPSDTDSEEDYRRAFIEPRMRMPAPHELGLAADTHHSFIPEGQAGQRGANGTAPPPPPRKDDGASQVPMPPMPSAPAFDVNQAGEYDQSQNADQGYNPNNTQYSSPRYSMSRRSGDSEGGYGHKRKSSNSLIGKMSRLFKTDIHNDAPDSDQRPGWNTRIAGNVEQGERRRSGFFRPSEPDSSDEEPDTRQVFRNVNQQRPGYPAIGGKGKLSSGSRILPGPQSNRIHDAEQAEIDRIRASVVGGGIGSSIKQPAAGEADSIRSTTTGTKKKKKKKKRPVAGSEIGTAPTRPSASYTISGDLSSLRGNSSADPPGLSRSSTMKSTSSKKKNRASTASSGLIGGNVFSPNAGKYGADSWIKKPASQMTAYEAVAMAGVVPKSAAPKDKPASTTTTTPAAVPSGSLSPTTAGAAAGNASRPASVMSGSAGKSAPLKSALKTPTLSRANSTSSAKDLSKSPKKASGSSNAATVAAPGLPAKSALRNDITQSIRAEPLPQPKMEPIPKAPAPVTSQPLPETVASQPAPAVQAAPVQAAPQAQAAPVASQPAAATSAPAASAAVTAPATETADPAAAPQAAGEAVPKAPQSVLSIEEDKGFDGTGRLDLSTDGAASAATQINTAPQAKAQMPKLDMPSSEPFSISFDGVNKVDGARRGSAVTMASNAEDGVVTPGAEQTYKAFIQEHGQSPSIERSGEATPIGTKSQPNGVTRLTDRKVKLEPSRVYGAGGPELSDTSSEEGSAVQAAEKNSKQAEGGAQKAAQVQASSALADPTHQPDPSLQSLSSAPVTSDASAPALSGTPAAPAKALNLAALAVPNKAPSETDSVVARRKSVRMAPDTKLPPDTPTDGGDFETPRGNEHGGQDPLAARGSQLRNRIAPLPSAPTKPTKEPGPIDLGAGRQPTGWTSRVRNNADSSDDEDADEDGYSSARKAFGSATRGWGEAMGTSKPKKKAGDAGSVRSKVSTKSKKGAAAGKRGSEVGGGSAVATPAAPQPSIGYVPTAPGSISSTLYTAKAPGSSVGAGASAPPPSSSMYSVTAPGSVVSGSVVPPSTSTAPASTPAATTIPQAPAQAPAPLTASNLNTLDSNKDRPNMPPVPVAPPAQGQSTISVPTAPPPAVSGKVSSSGGKGFFRRFKRNK